MAGGAFMNKENIAKAVKEAREKTKERKFKQTFDLAVAFKDMDMKNPASKFKEDVVLPHGRGKDARVGAIAEGQLAETAKKAGIKTILGKDDLGNLAKNRRKAKTLVKEIDVFISQPDLMAEVGKTLGPILGPRNKMPKPIPPNVPDLKPVLDRFSKVITIRVKNDPIIHCMVGTENLDDSQITDNAEAALKAIENKLPKGASQIRSIHIKTTMGPSARVEP